MKVIVRIYNGRLLSGTKEAITEALEEDNLLLTGESDMPAGAADVHDGFPDGFHELIFEEEVVDAEVDTPEEKNE